MFNAIIWSISQHGLKSNFQIKGISIVDGFSLKQYNVHWFLGEEQSHGKRVGALKRRFKSAKVHLLMTQQNSRRISVDSLLPMPGAVVHSEPKS